MIEFIVIMAGLSIIVRNVMEVLDLIELRRRLREDGRE